MTRMPSTAAELRRMLRLIATMVLTAVDDVALFYWLHRRLRAMLSIDRCYDMDTSDWFTRYDVASYHCGADMS